MRRRTRQPRLLRDRLLLASATIAAVIVPAGVVLIMVGLVRLVNTCDAAAEAVPPGVPSPGHSSCVGYSIYPIEDHTAQSEIRTAVSWSRLGP
jgi:hypothetical protein